MPDWWGSPTSPITEPFEYIATGPVNAIAATGTLTSNNTNVSNNDTVTIGTKTYTFKTSLTPAEGEILIGGTADASLLNLARAINASGGTPGTDYQVAAAHTLVTAATSITSHAFAVTARTKGTVGNAIVTSEVAVTLSWGGATLAGGVNGTVAKRGKGYQDGTYAYVATADNTTADTNWRRVSLGSAY